MTLSEKSKNALKNAFQSEREFEIFCNAIYNNISDEGLTNDIIEKAADEVEWFHKMRLQKHRRLKNDD